MRAATHPDPPVSRPEIPIEPVFYERTCRLPRPRPRRRPAPHGRLHSHRDRRDLLLDPRRVPRAGRMQSDLAAAAADLEHVVEFLRRLGGGIFEVEESPEESELRGTAERWAERLGRLGVCAAETRSRAQGSYGVDPRREEEAMQGHRGRRATPETARNPLAPEGLRRRAAVYFVPAPRRWLGIACVAVPRIRPHGARNATARFCRADS